MSTSHVQDKIIQLTQDALEAARKGQWDQVSALYNHDLLQKPLKTVSPETMQSLVESNQWLIGRVQEAQAAIEQNLRNIQDQRRQLEALKRQWGIQPSTHARHLLSV